MTHHFGLLIRCEFFGLFFNDLLLNLLLLVCNRLGTVTAGQYSLHDGCGTKGILDSFGKRG